MLITKIHSIARNNLLKEPINIKKVSLFAYFCIPIYFFWHMCSVAKAIIQESNKETYIKDNEKRKAFLKEKIKNTIIPEVIFLLFNILWFYFFESGFVALVLNFSLQQLVTTKDLIYISLGVSGLLIAVSMEMYFHFVPSPAFSWVVLINLTVIFIFFYQEPHPFYINYLFFLIIISAIHCLFYNIDSKRDIGLLIIHLFLFLFVFYLKNYKYRNIYRNLEQIIQVSQLHKKILDYQWENTLSDEALEALEKKLTEQLEDIKNINNIQSNDDFLNQTLKNYKEKLENITKNLDVYLEKAQEQKKNLANITTLTDQEKANFLQALENNFSKEIYDFDNNKELLKDDVLLYYLQNFENLNITTQKINHIFSNTISKKPEYYTKFQWTPPEKNLGKFIKKEQKTQYLLSKYDEGIIINSQNNSITINKEKIFQNNQLIFSYNKGSPIFLSFSPIKNHFPTLFKDPFREQYHYKNQIFSKIFMIFLLREGKVKLYGIPIKNLKINFKNNLLNIPIQYTKNQEIFLVKPFKNFNTEYIHLLPTFTNQKPLNLIYINRTPWDFKIYYQQRPITTKITYKFRSSFFINNNWKNQFYIEALPFNFDNYTTKTFHEIDEIPFNNKFTKTYKVGEFLSIIFNYVNYEAFFKNINTKDL